MGNKVENANAAALITPAWPIRNCANSSSDKYAIQPRLAILGGTSL